MDEAAGEVRVGCPAEQGARGLIAAGLAHAPTRTACETWAKATFSRENSITRARSPSAVGRGETPPPARQRVATRLATPSPISGGVGCLASRRRAGPPARQPCPRLTRELAHRAYEHDGG